MILAPVPGTSVQQATGPTTSAAFGAMVAGAPNLPALYILSTTTACYFLQGAAPVAAAATSTLLPAGSTTILDGSLGAKIAVIQESAAGSVTLTRAKWIR